MNLLPAHYLIEQTIQNSTKDSENGTTTSSGVRPPFVECQLFVHEGGGENSTGLTILSRLQL